MILFAKVWDFVFEPPTYCAYIKRRFTKQPIILMYKQALKKSKKNAKLNKLFIE